MSQLVAVGLDGTRESTAAAEWAAGEAVRRDVPLCLVQVREPDGAALYSGIYDDETVRQWAQQITEEAVAALTRRHPALRTTTRLLKGWPAKLLSDVSKGADLLVLGSRGLGSVLGFLIGSVGLPTVAHAACPVVLVRAARGTGAENGQEQPARSEASAKRPRGAVRQGPVVLGVDLQQPGEEVLAFAFETAAGLSVPLAVVHGWEPPLSFTAAPVAASPSTAGELLAERERALHNTLRPWRDKYPGVELHPHVGTGRPAPLLLEAAAEASLLVVGRRRSSRVGMRIGPVSHAAMHHAHTPVAVVPHD